LKPWEILAESSTAAGTRLTLWRRDRLYVIKVDGRDLMASDAHGSEEAMATLACQGLGREEQPRVLVGGLGMGFTLRATLDRLPAASVVTVAELSPELAAWNRGPLAPLAERPLEDPRVELHIGDVGELLRSSRAAWHAVLLDVDNGPVAITPGNESLYTVAGLEFAHRALRPGGRLVVWSAFDDRGFTHRLRQAGFRPSVAHARSRGKRGGRRHTLFLGIARPATDLKR
jgi:spermidine synthase